MAVALAALAERIEELGPVAYVVTVGADALPHVVSARARWADEELVMAAGRHTAANAEANPDVTLLWPAPHGGAYALIVDGVARLRDGGGAGEVSIGIAPVRAVLHRTPEGDPEAPSCVTVVPRAERAPPDLPAIRERLDRIDAQLVDLLARRAALIADVIHYKRARHMAIVDRPREAAMLERIGALAADRGLDPRVAQQVLRTVIDAFTVSEAEELGTDRL